MIYLLTTLVIYLFNSSSNNNHAKSNIVASSSSLDSTNDSLNQVTLEQENSLLKRIIEKGVYKSLAGSKQFEEILCKQGRHRKNQGVGFERKFNANGVEWEEINTPRRSLFLNKRSMILLPSREHKLKTIFHHKTTRTKARTSFKKRLMHLKKHLKPRSVGSPRLSLFLNKICMILLLSKGHKLKMIFHHKTTSKKARTSFKRRLMHLKKLPRPWSSGFPRLHQVLLHQVRLQPQGFSSR